MSDTPAVSVVIVTWNRRAELEKLLDSLERQTIAERIETIVIDNGSTDGTLEWLRERGRRLTLYTSGRNVGPAVGRNVGIHLARAPYCCFVDSDAWLEQEDILERLVAHLDERPDCCGASTFIFLDPKHEGIFCRGCYYNRYGLFDPDRTFRDWDDPHYLTTCFAVYRRADLERAKGFDNFYGYGIEDGDLGFTVKRLTGGHYHVDPDRSVIHEMSLAGREHHWHAFHPKFKYHEKHRHYLVLKRDGLGAMLRNMVEVLGKRQVYYRFYHHPVSRWQRFLAFVWYPAVALVMLPYLLLHRRRDHLANDRPDPARVERIGEG